MSEKQDVQNDLVNWAAWIRERRLVTLALMALHLVDVWGVVGEQLVWALMPFLNQKAQLSLTEIVEHPESLHQLQALLAEGDD